MEEIKAEMAGSMWKMLVAVGDKVEAGEDVAIMESMKMEIPMTSEQGGTVKEIKVNEGDFINEGDIVVIVE